MVVGGIEENLSIKKLHCIKFFLNFYDGPIAEIMQGNLIQFKSLTSIDPFD